jgi:hypothetical protein
MSENFSAEKDVREMDTSSRNPGNGGNMMEAVRLPGEGPDDAHLTTGQTREAVLGDLGGLGARPLFAERGFGHAVDHL